jgi:hypothetical protein
MAIRKYLPLLFELDLGLVLDLDSLGVAATRRCRAIEIDFEDEFEIDLAAARPPCDRSRLIRIHRSFASTRDSWFENSL